MCCPNRHSPGCGCKSDAFISQAHNFSPVLSESDSAEDFVEKLLVLARHARNEHEWDGGQCGFHPLRVCRVVAGVETLMNYIVCR